MARLLTMIILLNFDIPSMEITAETEKDRKKYIEALRKADERDYSLLEKIMGETITESLKNVLKP